MYQGSQVKREQNPKEKASFFNIAFVIYTLNIFKKSAKYELQESDVYEVINNVESSKLGDALEAEWDKEKPKTQTSFTKVLFRVFGREYMWYGFLNLIVTTLLKLILPSAIGRLVSYFTPGSPLTIHDAYYYSGVIISISFIELIFIHWYMLQLTQLGLRLRVAICSLIYRKSLKLTSTSLMEITNGKIVTMVTKDVIAFDLAIFFAHDLWIGLIHVAAMTYIMWTHIQISAIIGIGFLIALIPIQIWIGKKTTEQRLKTSARTDERLRRIQEILTSIKLIKLYTWEKYYTQLTNNLRTNEMKQLLTIFYMKSIILSIAELSQRISFYICIFAYIYLGNVVTPEKVFVVIGCYESLRHVLCDAVPMSIAQLSEAKSSVKRIKKYLLIEEVTDKPSDTKLIVTLPRIQIQNAKVEFLGKIILHDINLELKPSLVGVTGSVGSGKSTLLKLILEDVRLSNGNVFTNGILSYASQEPWLFPGTIKQNILFGLPYERERYQQIVKICALTRDLESFQERDNTIVNDKGLNLSKGQQARINLARAVYKRADIYLLDDIMSALDASVSKFIFNSCIKDFLKDKICIIICHNKRFLSEMDNVLVMDAGTIKALDTFNTLEKAGIDFGVTVTVDSCIGKDDKVDNNKKANVDENADENSKLLASMMENLDSAGIYGETKKKGKVDFSMYSRYFKYAGGFKCIPLFLLLVVAGQVATSYFDVYITKWLEIEQVVSEYKVKNLTHTEEYVQVEINHKIAMSMYSIIIIAATVLTTARLFIFFGLTARASRKLHEIVFNKITGACLSFFDQHLSGNILNRFSKDFCTIDELLPYAYLECIKVFFIIIGITGVVAYVNPMLLGPAAVTLVLLLVARYYFLTTSRTLKRLDGTTRAPVIGYLNASLEGLTTIRASGNQSILKSQFDRHQDLNSSASYMCITTSRAFALWADLLCNVYFTIIVLSFVFLDSKNQLAGDVGLAITQGFGLAGVLQWGIRQWTEVENQMTSVERVVEYEAAEQEDLTGQDPNNWPTVGRIEYKNVSLTYTNSDKRVLNDVSFVVQPNEKIGIIGRTGAGKSSIISVLFRLYKIEGSIIIDGIDIKDIELEIVRSKISIIPQDPVLFAGTIRSNLDPNNLHTDLELWNALGEVELKNVVENFDMGLSSVVNGGGANFSIGQRQLICLARAIIRNNKILVLDEATANIDPQTDALIQTTIKRLFGDCTILTIAHRLNTIINSDKIMVVDFGSVLEYDAPGALLGRREGIFYSMAKQAGLVN